MIAWKKLREAAAFAVQVFAIVFVSKSFAVASNFIPSESMVPTLEVGDRIFVSKWPYGYSRYSLLADPKISLPGKDGRLFGKSPARGDVVVFTHPINGETMIKRVIGLPGDRIALYRGRLFINGELVPRTERRAYSYRDDRGSVVAVTRYDETLPGGRVHPIIERSDNGFADEFGEVTVPAGRLFIMGDNRDNSADSRFAEMGFVPVENVQGRADLIGWSLYTCADEPGLTCATRRTLTAIE
jgi:signal peptidase I